MGFDLFKRGDYENAELYYKQAQKRQDELTLREREDLRLAIERNNVALQQRREAGARVRMAEDALQQGRPIEANNLLKLADTQYLSGRDRQVLVRLQERLRNTKGMGDGPSLPPAPGTPVIKGDYKSLLTAARSALQRGELEMAEALCVQAEKVGPSSFSRLNFFAESPTKIRRDIHTMRARLAITPPPDKKESSTPFKGIKGMFSRPAPEDVRQVGNDGPMLPPPKGNEKGAMESPSPLQTIKTAMSWPTSLLPGGGSNDKNPPATAAQRTEHARDLVRQARYALQNGDPDTARRLAVQARELHADIDISDPESPTRVLAEIQRGTPSMVSTRNNPPAPPAPPAPTAQTRPETALASSDPRELVKQARVLIGQNRLEDAGLLCEKAASTSTKWGLFEDSPQKVQSEISGRMLTEARKLFTQGMYKEAKSKAYRAQQLHGAYGVWELGDRPTTLIAEIERVEAKDRQAVVGRDAGAQAKNSVGVAAPPPLNKQRAQALVAEARELEKNGRLLEARLKALQAAQLNVTYAADEDTPRNVTGWCRVYCSAST